MCAEGCGDRHGVPPLGFPVEPRGECKADGRSHGCDVVADGGRHVGGRVVLLGEVPLGPPGGAAAVLGGCVGECAQMRGCGAEFVGEDGGQSGQETT